MLRSSSTAALLAALMLGTPLMATDALAHGGAYRGPPGEVPPDSREPSDPPPPPEGGGPTTPGGEGGGPITPGGDVGGPETPGGGGQPPGGGTGTGGGPGTGGSNAGGPRSGGVTRRATKGPGYDDWTYWWTFNKDEFLRLKARLGAQGADTGMTAHAFGKSKSDGQRITATAAAIQQKIVPRLLAALEDPDTHFDVRGAAAIAIAKCGDTKAIPLLEKMARNDDNKYHRQVQEASALAFGLLQSDTEQVREILVDLMSDTSRDGTFVRPFAAISLGLLEGDDPQHTKAEALLRVLTQKEKQGEVKPAALLALGLLGDDVAVAPLLETLDAGRIPGAKQDLDDISMSYVVQALGKIGCPSAGDEPHAVVDAMLGLVSSRKGRKVPVHVRRSAAIALGQLAPACDTDHRAKIVKQLKSAATDATDSSVQAFSIVSLGRLAAAVDDADLRDDVARTLRHHLARARRSNLIRPFAALSLALAGGENARDEDYRKPVRDELARSARSDPRVRGAYAIASGLMDDSLATEALIEVVEDRGSDSRLRAYSSVALGLIGDPQAHDVVRRLLASDADRDLRMQAAVSAGLLGDGGAVTELVKILESGREGQYVLGSIALALGQIGDERAIDPLLEIMDDSERKHSDVTRALATVALGQIGDQRDVPVLARVGTDINFRTLGAVDALTELLTIL